MQEWIYLFDKAEHKAWAQRHETQFVTAVGFEHEQYTNNDDYCFSKCDACSVVDRQYFGRIYCLQLQSKTKQPGRKKCTAIRKRTAVSDTLND